MLLLDSCKKIGELLLFSQRLKPRIIQHGGITKEPTTDHTLKEFKRGAYVVQACKMSGQIEKSFGVIECRSDDSLDCSGACSGVAFYHRPGGYEEIAHSGVCLLFQSPRRRDRLVLSSGFSQ